MIIANAGAIVITALIIVGMRQARFYSSPINLGVGSICALANIGFAIALLRWRRWGFYGFLVTSVIALINNLAVGVGIGQSLVGLIGVALSYWVLNMGGADKAWPRLK